MDEATLYQRDAVRRLDAAAIEQHGIAGYTLMQRAAAAAFDVLRAQWPDARRLLVVAGGGNNGGDGLDLALRARNAGLDVTLALLADPARITGAAGEALAAWQAAGGDWIAASAMDPSGADVIVDALLGIGLDRPVEGERRQAIDAINASGRPVLALDIPSGLDADTGAVLGAAVRATHTVSFIGVKVGTLQGDGPAVCGTLHFADCDVPAAVYVAVAPVGRRMRGHDLSTWVAPRGHQAHKGDFGHLAVVGGQPGMPGAALMAARAALRSGIGRVSVITHGDHAALLPLAQVELMTHALGADDGLRGAMESVTALVVGPGLGQGVWGRHALQQALDAAGGRPVVLDADALNLVAGTSEQLPAGTVMTPHPGEAARLLGVSTAEVQSDRVTALASLVDRYGCTVVLKGAGTWVGMPGATPWLCPLGNPGMAVGGMGDVLAGMIGALAAGPLDLWTAARAGVMAHALAGDATAVCLGQTAMTPSDLVDQLATVWPRP